jgi:hypothetical protein
MSGGGGATQAFAIPKAAPPPVNAPNTPYEPSEYTRMMSAQKAGPAGNPLVISPGPQAGMPQMSAMPQMNFPQPPVMPAMQMPQPAGPVKAPPNMLVVGILVLLALLMVGIIVLLLLKH